MKRMNAITIDIDPATIDPEKTYMVTVTIKGTVATVHHSPVEMIVDHGLVDREKIMEWWRDLQ